MADLKIRKGMPFKELSKSEFKSRFLSQYIDPAFKKLASELDLVANAAWDGYIEARKSPLTEKAGPGFKNPDYDLAQDWIATKTSVDRAQKHHVKASAKSRILLINASSRSEHTCPGEMSKSYRLVKLAQAIFDAQGIETDLLDLSLIASEYGRHIHPCKACFSTAAALCHWPCSCYPNYSLGQTQDWMNEIYPMWVAAHGVMIVTPVNWFQATSPLKLMMDRLVCADGGNSDPTSTDGKDAALAKALEMADWPYPRHLEGRIFSVVVHGDTEGTQNLRRMLCDWLTSMHLEPAGAIAEIDRYIGYYEPYATSHAALDADHAIQEEVRNAARALVTAVKAKRSGKMLASDDGLIDPRPK